MLIALKVWWVNCPHARKNFRTTRGLSAVYTRMKSRAGSIVIYKKKLKHTTLWQSITAPTILPKQLFLWKYTKMVLYRYYRRNNGNDSDRLYLNYSLRVPKWKGNNILPIQIGNEKHTRENNNTKVPSTCASNEASNGIQIMTGYKLTKVKIV